MKIAQIYIIILFITKSLAANWNCVFQNTEYSFTSLLKESIVEDYTCYISSDTSTASDVPEIGGDHRGTKVDEDVKVLFFAGNLKTFSDIFCDGFENLEAILAWEVDIAAIDENSLQKCPNLRIFHLKENNLRQVPDDLLNKNSKLTQVWIYRNELSSLPTNFFNSQNNLEELVLDHNQLQNLPNRIFQNLVKLQYLDIQSNKLQVLKPEWFENLRSLKMLLLQDNELLGVPGGVFKSLNSLENLWLGRNNIKILHSESFNGLQSLKVLALNENEITELPRVVFVPLVHLKELDLGTNKLITIHADSFGSNKKLTEIYLEFNKIESMDEELLSVTSIRYFNMTGNVCSNEEIRVLRGSKAKLKNCFDNYFSWLPEPPSIEQYGCGKQSSIISARVVKGNVTEVGEFPWIAALVRKDGILFCGGTLISDKKVVTAAHCIHSKRRVEKRNKDSFMAWLGVHNLNLTHEPGRQKFDIKSIKIHPDWDISSERYDADITVLVLDRDVSFDKFIQPICLIQSTSIIASIKYGTVVGFGRSEDTTRGYENIARKIENFPIHTNEYCFLTDYRLAMYSTKRTVCVGSGNGVGVCDGDSGSGIYVIHNNAFFLRGVVSASLWTRTHGCDVDSFAIFTDMIHFNDWVIEV